MSNTSMEIWLAQIQAMFKRHRLEIEEIIDARMDNIMNHIQSLNKNDPSKKDKVEEGTSAKEAKEGSYQEADNVKDKESSVKKEKNKQPKVRPTRVQPKPQLQNRSDLNHGWGLDILFGYCAQGDRTKTVGVVDAEYIVHYGFPTFGEPQNKCGPIFVRFFHWDAGFCVDRYL
ncbi:hypothetical protein CTI12_AA166770 [Artemisia annua]|uniref:Uncharacterized protein n=1 Tax=Artemisia annua TaxID=35608 RepID=A0A2U1MWV2_ARTAN|nr:hypothetical protein CTI12_AA166770 [Artemisia annua]